MAETEQNNSVLRGFDFDGLTDAQISAAEMLQSGKYTLAEIGEAVGVHPVTVCRWQKNEKFMAAVKKCQQEKIRQTLSMLSEGAPLATEVLFDLLKSGDKRVQMEAAKYILDRNLGKTTSKVIVTDEDDKEKDFDLDELVAEIEAEQKQE